MAELQKLINISSENNPMYQIRVNDGGPDGGNNARIAVFVEYSGGFTIEDIENGIQELASSLSSLPNATLLDVTKVVSIETLL